MAKRFVFFRCMVWLTVVAALTGCRGTGKQHSTVESSPAAPTATEERLPGDPTGSETKKPARIEYSVHHDEEIKEIFHLAKKAEWQEAEAQAILLYEMDPQDPAVERVYHWVIRQGQQSRNADLEDQIREIDANNSGFNPTLPDLLTENKNRGLPPRKDVRDAIDKIENTPYIPPSFGRTNYLAGPMFSFESEQGRMAKILDKEISVHLDDVSLEAIIFNIGEAESINFVADKSLPAFQQKLSLNIDRVTLREFMRYLARNYNLQFQVGDGLIWIVDATDKAKVQEETRFYRLREGLILPAQWGASETTRTTTTRPDKTVSVAEVEKIEKFVNDNAPNEPAVLQAIQQFFKGSTYMVDLERNLIVATGTPEQLEVLEEIIDEFDKPIQQVLIEARFITLTKPAFMQLGVVWETGRSIAAARVPQDFTDTVASDNVNNLSLGLQHTFTNILDSSTLSATISALEQSGESQTLSAPRLTVINNRPARIADGKEQYYYEEYTVATTVTDRNSASTFVPKGKPTKLQAGVELEVLASISGDGQTINLALHPKVSEDVKLVTFATLSDVDADGNIVSSFDIRLPEARTQELATRVAVRSGQTVVMGGVLSREQATFLEAVPVLGSIPIIGSLFRRRTDIDRPRYLLIFVTATIVAETGEFIIYQNPEN